MAKIRVNILKNHFKNLVFKKNNLANRLDKQKKLAKPVKFKEAVLPKKNLEGCKNNCITYQIRSDLFTLLYSSIVFQWIESERVNKILIN